MQASDWSPWVAGLVGLGDAEVVGETVSTLHAFDIPLVLASPRLAEMVTQEGNTPGNTPGNTLTTAPDLGSIVQVSGRLSNSQPLLPSPSSHTL